MRTSEAATVHSNNNDDDITNKEESHTQARSKHRFQFHGRNLFSTSRRKTQSWLLLPARAVRGGHKKLRQRYRSVSCYDAVVSMSSSSASSSSPPPNIPQNAQHPAQFCTDGMEVEFASCGEWKEASSMESSSSYHSTMNSRIVMLELPETGIELLEIPDKDNNNLNSNINSNDKEVSSVTGQGEQMDDDISWVTADSLLSTEDSTEPKIAKSIRGLERLEQQFELRDKQMKILERKIRRRARRSRVPSLNQYYLSVLKMNEEATRQTLRNKLLRNWKPKQQQEQPSDSSSSSTKSSSSSSDLSLAAMPTQMSRDILFELCHGIPGLMVIVFNCFSCITFYKVFCHVMEQLHAYALSYTMSTPIYYGLSILIGLLIIRCSGYVWSWLDSHSYGSVKFELHNRLRLGYWDAKLFMFFKQRKPLFSIVNMASFYMAYIGMAYFYDLLVNDLLMDGMLIKWHNTLMENPLAEFDMTTDDDWSASKELCEILSNQLHAEGWMTKFLGMHLCRAEQDLSMILFVIDSILFTIFARLLLWQGFNFLESMD